MDRCSKHIILFFSAHRRRQARARHIYCHRQITNTANCTNKRFVCCMIHVRNIYSFQRCNRKSSKKHYHIQPLLLLPDLDLHSQQHAPKQKTPKSGQNTAKDGVGSSISSSSEPSQPCKNQQKQDSIAFCLNKHSQYTFEANSNNR